MTPLRLMLPICTAAFVASTSSALAWGQLGHSVIAELAQRHLIGDTSLAAISNWADDYKFTPDGKSTYRWHFVDIDVERSSYDGSLDCKDVNNQGTCIVQGLPAALAVLKDSSQSREDRLRALKLFVHLAGDLEQPLHASERNGDQGGNKLHVVLHAKRSDGTGINIPQHVGRLAGRSAGILMGSYADALDTSPLPAVEAPPFNEARIAAWANETHTLGIKAYQLLPPGTPDHNDPGHPVDLNNDYASSIKADLDSELAKGAARLKAMLDDALGGP